MLMFANGLATWIFAITAIIAFVVTLFFIIEDSKRNLIGWVIASVLTILLGVGWLYAATHRVVPANHTGVAFNRTTGETGNINQGVVRKGINETVAIYPAAKNYQICDTYTPSVKGGYGVTLNLCFYIDAATVDWREQYFRYNTKDVNTMYTAWKNQLSPKVALAVSTFTPAELTKDRDKVAERIYAQASSWLKQSEDITLNSVSIQNWDFSSAEVASAYDQTVAAQALVQQEAARKEASEARRERELYEAETTIQVARELRKAADALGLSGDQVVEFILIRAYLEQSEGMPDNAIFNIGGGGPIMLSPPETEQETLAVGE